MRVCCEFLKSPLGYTEFLPDGVIIDDGLDCDGVLVCADRVFVPDTDSDGIDECGAKPEDGRCFDFRLESLRPRAPSLAALSPSTLPWV